MLKEFAKLQLLADLLVYRSWSRYRLHPDQLFQFAIWIGDSFILRDIVTVRGQSYFSRLPKYWPPIPLSARRVCPPPATKAEGTHSPGGEGDGGSIFWKTREIGLPSYSNNLSTFLSIGAYSFHVHDYVTSVSHWDQCQHKEFLHSKSLLQGAALKEDPIYVFSEMKLRGFIPNSHIHVCMSDLYIPRIRPPTVSCCSKIGRPNLGIYSIEIAHRYMNGGIGSEDVQFHFWE